MAFTQIITVQGADEQAVHDLVASWDESQGGVAPGYQGARVLTDDDGRHLIEVDFTSQQEARRNDDRAETQRWADQLRDLVDSEPTYQDLRQVCTTYNRD